MKPVMLVTGACGFIGQAACRYFADRYYLIGIDNLSRYGAHAWDARWGELLVADVTDVERLPLPAPRVVLHLAAQVSVTRSVSSPQSDFDTNAKGTFALALWAKRQAVSTFLYASTNKIYGSLAGVSRPINDDQPLCPETPYGVSKAVGDLYVRELLPDAGYCFVQSCIYGQEQRGTVDQGWVAWLWRSVAEGRPIICYGDGRQTRDLLHVDDLLAAYDLAIHSRRLPPGRYVTGGGIENAFTFEEVVASLGGRIAEYQAERPRDQHYFVSANRGLTAAGWTPQKRAVEFLREHRRANDIESANRTY